MNEVLKLQRVVGTVHCVRRGAPVIYNELKATGIPVLHFFERSAVTTGKKQRQKSPEKL